MLYIFYYIILGAIIGVLTWFFYYSKRNKCSEEGNACIYLFCSMFLWPIILIGIFIDYFKFIRNK
jgi:membrane-associated HD superfamily phosphohydrolase